MVQATRSACGVVALAVLAVEAGVLLVLAGLACLVAGVLVLAGLVVVVPVAAQCWVLWRTWAAVVGAMDGDRDVVRRHVAPVVGTTEAVTWTADMVPVPLVEAVPDATRLDVPAVVVETPTVCLTPKAAAKVRKPRAAKPVLAGYASWTVVQLRAECRTRGLAASGLKAVLVGRLVASDEARRAG